MTSIESYFTMQAGKVISQDVEKVRNAITCLPDGFYTNRIEKIIRWSAEYLSIVIAYPNENL